MNLNARNREHGEQRMKKRRLLEEERIDYIRSCVRDELELLPPEAGWSAEALNDLEAAKMDESLRIVEALSTPELENESAMERYVEAIVMQIRMDLHRRQEPKSSHS
jgi:hypothetical protein